MSQRPDLSFKAQRDALTKAASNASVDNGFGQAMQSAQSLLQGFTESAGSLKKDPGNGVTAEALQALWDGKNSGLQTGIDNLRNDLNSIPDVPNMGMGGAQSRTNGGPLDPANVEGYRSLGINPEREQQVFAAFRKAGFTPQESQAWLLNVADESGFKADITEGAPNVHGTRGQGLYQLTDIKPGQGRRTDYLNFMKQNKRNDLWSDDSQAQFAFWESENTEKASWQKIRQQNTVGGMGAALVTHNLRPARQHMNERAARYASIGY